MGMGRRLIFCCSFVLLACCGTANAAVSQSQAWAGPSIRTVAAAGLMGAKNVASFRADDPLTAQTLENLVYEIKARLTPVPEGGDAGNEPGWSPPTTLPVVTVPTVTGPVTT